MRQARCDRCGFVKWVNVVTSGGKHAGEFCADCFDSVPKDAVPRNRTVKSAGLGHNNPWQDNAVRAMEGE